MRAGQAHPGIPSSKRVLRSVSEKTPLAGSSGRCGAGQNGQSCPAMTSKWIMARHFTGPILLLKADKEEGT